MAQYTVFCTQLTSFVIMSILLDVYLGLSLSELLSDLGLCWHWPLHPGVAEDTLEIKSLSRIEL